MSRPDVVASCETAKRIVDALLMATSDDVHAKLTRLDKGQPGSVLRSLRLTRDRLTGERGSEIMLNGPAAERLTVRVNELVGNVGLVGASVFDLSEEGREHANRAPVALSIPLRDELVRAISTLDRLLGSAVELRKWREVREVELASLVETSDPAANAIRHQRRVEIAGEIALVNQRETELLGDVYEVSNAVRRGLEERTHLLSNLIRLGLGSIPKSQVTSQPVTAEQLSNMEIPDRAKRWSELPNTEKERLIANDFEKLRNLDGIDGPSRERMQENYIQLIIAEGGPRLKKLEELGFVQDGQQTQRFVYLTLDMKTHTGTPRQQRGVDVEASYVTAHGCEDYKDLQFVVEGTGTNPNKPKGMGNLDKTDGKAAWLSDRGTCRTFLVIRNVDFPQWNLRDNPVTSAAFSNSDEEKILNLMGGMSASGAGSTATSLRAHSAGNSIVPRLDGNTRKDYGIHLDAIIMDDPAMDAELGFESFALLPHDIPVMYAKQSGVVSLAIRARYGTDLTTITHGNVTVYDYTKSLNEAEWLARAPDLEFPSWKDPFAPGKLIWRGARAAKELRGYVLAQAKDESAHDQGWTNTLQYREENAFIKINTA